MGTNLYELKRYDESRQAYEEGIEVARRIGDLRMLAYGLYNAAGAYIDQGELMRAEAQLKEAEALFRKLHEPVMDALIRSHYGYLWEKRGRWPLAKQNLFTGLEMLRGRHETDFARTAFATAFCFQKNGEPDVALKLLDEALVVARRLRLKGLVAVLQQSLLEWSQPSVSGHARVPAPDGATHI